QGPPVAQGTSTGTTIVGCLYVDGIVIGADTRGAEGNIVADMNCKKIHYIPENILCCGAGTAARTELTTTLISSNRALHDNCTSSPQAARRVATGPHLFTVHPHCSIDKLPYVTMNTGSLAAMAVLEFAFSS
ncbi:N-terminal nucleophile aminohydrolase, partial [Auricularia subglabra TFB-10046 SS5]